MTSTNQDIPTQDGDRFVAGDSATINDDVDTDDGSAKDISGFDGIFGLADYPGGSTIATKDNTGGGGLTITDGANGKLEVVLDPSDTQDLGSADGREYYYEIELTDSGGDEATVTTGTITIYADTV